MIEFYEISHFAKIEGMLDWIGFIQIKYWIIRLSKGVHMFLGKMLILAILLKLAKPKPLAPAAGSPAT